MNYRLLQFSSLASTRVGGTSSQGRFHSFVCLGLEPRTQVSASTGALNRLPSTS